MKTRTCVLTFVLCLLASAVCFAEDPQLGTWKLNEAKSKLAAGLPHNNTLVYEAAGDSIKVTISGRVVISADGKTRTVTVNATDAAGKKVKGTTVYDKQ